MKTSAKMVIMSHLSDVQETQNFKLADPAAQKELDEQNNLRLNFVKWLVDNLMESRLDENGQPNDGYIEIDADELFEQFTEVMERKKRNHWCECGGDFDNAIYFEDNVHPDLKKHHWRCRKCNGIVQIG